MTHELQQIEDGVLAALGPLRDLGVRTLEAYGGQVEDAADLARITARFPAVWVVAEGLEVAPVNQVDRVTARISILVGDRNLRGPGKSVRGDSSSLGVYDILSAARNLVNGLRVISSWSALAWVGDSALVVSPTSGLCLFVSKFRATTALGR